jgi:hypothetical protein
MSPQPLHITASPAAKHVMKVVGKTFEIHLSIIF